MFKRISILILISLLVSITVKAQDVPEWTDVVGITYDEIAGTLTKIEVDGWNAGVRSWNRLNSNEDGIISYTVEDLVAVKAIGLSSLNDNYSLGSIDYAIALSGGKVNIYEKGKFRGKFGTFKVGDVFSVEREGVKIKFRKNGKKFIQRTTNPLAILYAEIAIYTQGATIGGFTTSLKKPIDITFVKQDITCTTGPNGSIDVTVTKGESPFTFLWNDGVTTEDRVGLDIGKYTVTINDAAGETYVKSIYINSQVAWVYLEGAVINQGGDLLTRLIYSNQNPYKLGRATSQNTLLSNTDGYVRYVVDENTTQKILALKDKNSLPLGVIDGSALKYFDYAFYLDKDILFIFENGKLIGKYGELKIGSEIEIAREGSYIFYRLNRKHIRSVLTEPLKELQVKGELLSDGGTFNNVKTDFCNLSLMATYTTVAETPTTLGSISLNPFGGAEEYYYFWSDGDQNKDRFDLESGYYSVTIVDTLSDSLTVDIKLATETQFETLADGLSFANGELEKTEPIDSWTNGMATLQNQISKETQQGEVIVGISELGKEWIYGLRKLSELPASTYDKLAYGFYIKEDNLLYTYDAVVDSKKLAAYFFFYFGIL